MTAVFYILGVVVFVVGILASIGLHESATWSPRRSSA